MRPSKLLILWLLVLLITIPQVPVHDARALGISKVYVSPVATGGPSYPPGLNFNVSVMLSLGAGESINVMDVKLNYSGWGPAGPLIKAMHVDLSKNLFAGRPNMLLAECIDGIIQMNTSCSDYNAGEVEVGETLVGAGNLLVGPVTGVLFTVEFNVRVKGTSLFTIPSALILNPGSGYYPSPYFIQYVPLAGVFSNTGVAAFFNFEPLNPPAILPGGNVTFDARDSFNADNPIPIVTYSWDFGDGSSSGVGNQISHRFQLPGNFSVRLTVTDSGGSIGRVVRVVDVLPALGGLSVSVKDQNGVPLRGNVIVQLYNGTSTELPFFNKTTDFSGSVLFPRLIPRDYLLKLSGPTVINQSKTESAVGGVQTMDTVYLTLKSTSTPPPPADYGGLIYSGTILGGVGAFAAFVVWRRLRARREGSRAGAGRIESKAGSRMKR